MFGASSTFGVFAFLCESGCFRVCMISWVPKERARAAVMYLFRYRIYWPKNFVDPPSPLPFWGLGFRLWGLGCRAFGGTALVGVPEV